MFVYSRRALGGSKKYEGANTFVLIIRVLHNNKHRIRHSVKFSNASRSIRTQSQNLFLCNPSYLYLVFIFTRSRMNAREIFLSISRNEKNFRLCLLFTAYFFSKTLVYFLNPPYCFVHRVS